MGRAKRCCNPLNKSKHKKVTKNLHFVTKKWNAIMQKNKYLSKTFVGLHMCNSCRRSIYEKRSESKYKVFLSNRKTQNKIVGEESDSADPEQDEKGDPTFQYGEPSKKLSHKENQMFSKLLGEKNCTVDNDLETLYIRDIKAALSQQSNRSGKIQILTTIPQHWTIAKMRKEFEVSRRMASKAKKLRKESGHGSRPNKKAGRKLSNTTVSAVKLFYLSDDNSRVMPGMKDYISIVKDGKRSQKQKRLLLFNLIDLHKQFNEKFPEMPICLAKFRQLRPQECILAGKSGTHNVCVCKIHQNMKLKIRGLMQELKIKGANFTDTYQDLIKNSVCENPSSNCFFLSVKSVQKLSVLLKN